MKIYNDFVSHTKLIQQLSMWRHIKYYSIQSVFPPIILTYHFSLWTPKVKVKVAYSIVGRHFEFLIGVSVQYSAPCLICRLPRHSEALLIVQCQANILSVQRAAWKRGREREKSLKIAGVWVMSEWETFQWVSASVCGGWVIYVLQLQMSAKKTNLNNPDVISRVDSRLHFFLLIPDRYLINVLY